MNMKKVLLIAAIAFTSLTGRAQTPLTTAVDFTVTTVEGSTFNLFNTLASNKYVCIDFFYYGCVPCQQTAPKVNGAYEYFGCNSSNVVFIGIDNGDNTATTQAFGTNFGAHYPAASGSDGGGNAVNSAYGIGAYPTVILIAPNHSIIEQDIWPIADAASLYNLIQGHGGTPAACAAGIDLVTNGIASIAGIYPNPATDNAVVNVNLSNTSELVINIYNLTGQMVKTFVPDGLTVGANSIALPLSDLGSGVYIVKIAQAGQLSAPARLSVVK